MEKSDDVSRSNPNPGLITKIIFILKSFLTNPIYFYHILQNIFSQNY